MVTDDETRIAETDLDGATRPGEVNAWPSTPAEFAARWNAATEDERSDRLAAMIDASERSLACFVRDHPGQIARLKREVAERDAVIAEMRRGWMDPDLDGPEWNAFVYALLTNTPASALTSHDAETRERALKDALATIVEAAPPVNAELTLTPAGVVEDRGMAAYVEGVHDAWAALNSLIITEAADRAGADQ